MNQGVVDLCDSDSASDNASDNERCTADSSRRPNSVDELYESVTMLQDEAEAEEEVRVLPLLSEPVTSRPLEFDILDEICASESQSQSQSQSQTLPTAKRARVTYDYDQGTNSTSGSSSSSHRQKGQPVVKPSSSSSARGGVAMPEPARAPLRASASVSSASVSSASVSSATAVSSDATAGREDKAADKATGRSRTGKVAAASSSSARLNPNPNPGAGAGAGAEFYHRVSLTIEDSFPGSAAVADLLEKASPSSSSSGEAAVVEEDAGVEGGKGVSTAALKGKTPALASSKPSAKEKRERVLVTRKRMLYPGIVLLHSSEWAEEAGDVEDKGGGGGEGENRQRKVVEHYFPCGLCVYSAEKLVELAVADQRQRLYFAELNDDLDRMLACAKEHGLRPYANMTLIIVGLDGSITKFLRKQAGNSRDGVHTKASVSVAVDEALSSLLIDRKISTHHVADTAEMARYVQHFHESFDTSQTDKPLTHLDGVNKGKMFKLKEAGHFL